MTSLTSQSEQYLARIELSRELHNHETLWLQNFTSKQTRRTYEAAFREFCGLLGVDNPQAFRAISEAEIIRFRDYLIHTRGMSNRSVRNRLAALSSCFQYLRAKGVVTDNPVDGVERPKVDETVGETPAMTNAQVKQMLSQPDTNTLKGARDSAILHFLFFTGSRIGAPGSMHMKDFYQDKGFYVLRWRKKGGKNQVVPVAPQLQDALLHYFSMKTDFQEPDDPLFSPVKLGQNQGKGLSKLTYDRIWHHYRVKAGLPPEFTPHSARATFATVCDENGVPIQDIQITLGHANISTTQPYIHSRKKHKDSAVFSVKY